MIKKDKTKEVTKAVEDSIYKALESAALDIEGQAIELSPVGQYNDGTVGGNLKSSITHSIDVKKMEARVGTNVIYSARVEYGFTGVDSLGRKYNQSPRPYLRPAFDARKKIAIKLIEKALGDSIKGATK
jgi:phage gpG-like protein